jgi:hypothetical protein
LIRASAIILLTLIGVLASIPLAPANPSLHGIAANYQASSPSDPSPPPTTAFNYTYSQANLYTNSSAKTSSFPAGTKLTWLNTVTQTSDNTTIPRSAFLFNVTSANLAQGRAEVNYTLTVPQFNCQGCTGVSVNFNFFGNITKGTYANYTLFPLNSTTSYNSVGAFPSASSSNCPEEDCVNVTKYVGYNVILSFAFGWNGTNNSGMFASAGEIVVASIGNLFSSSTNIMQETDSSAVTHTATLSSIEYNNTLTTRIEPLNVNVTQLWWHTEVVSIYYPAGYKISQITLNETQRTIYPSPPEVPFEKDNCFPAPSCSESLIALNVTDFYPTSINSTITITAETPNSITQVSTLSGGVATQFFTSGDQIGIKVVVQPSIINASTSLRMGTVSITFPPALLIPTYTSPSTATGGVYSFTLPSGCGFNNQLCDKSLNVNASFTSGYDLGNSTASFRIDVLQVSLTGTGGTNSLSVQGTLEYGNGTAAPGVNATLFAIDTGTPVNTPTTNNQTVPSTSRLYVSNVTLVNGVFTQGQSLIMLFTIVNPNATQLYDATVNIEHEWPGPQPHNMSTTFSLHPGDRLDDLPLSSTQPQTYEASILFTGTGVNVTLENLRTAPDFETQTMSSGTSPVLPNTPDAGLFNVTVTSLIGNNTQTPASFLLSSPYAYVTPSLVPSRYLYGSPAFKTGPGGSFSETMNLPSAHILGAENLTVFVLARDAFGVVVMNNLPSSIFTESTALIANANSIGPVEEGDSATATLHLTSNSTLSNGITELITVNLILQGNGIGPKPVATQTNIEIIPGGSQTIHLSFTAPSSVGSYTLTFSSPEYGGVLTSETFQVTILQGYIQLLIPAAIGIVAAIIILGVYLIREQREKKEDMETPKPKGSSEKTKPAPGTKAPSKSLTRTPNLTL